MTNDFGPNSIIWTHTRSQKHGLNAVNGLCLSLWWSSFSLIRHWYSELETYKHEIDHFPSITVLAARDVGAIELWTHSVRFRHLKDFPIERFDLTKFERSRLPGVIVWESRHETAIIIGGTSIEQHVYVWVPDKMYDLICAPLWHLMLYTFCCLVFFGMLLQ